MARAVEAGIVVAVVVEEREERVGLWSRDEAIILADDEIEAVWTRDVRKRDPRWSKTRNEVQACERNISK